MKEYFCWSSVPMYIDVKIQAESREEAEEKLKDLLIRRDFDNFCFNIQEQFDYYMKNIDSEYNCFFIEETTQESK